MSPHKRDIFIHVYNNSLTTEDVAKAFNTTIHTIKQRAYELRKEGYLLKTLSISTTGKTYEEVYKDPEGLRQKRRQQRREKNGRFTTGG
jgi:hypothetical protein